MKSVVVENAKYLHFWSVYNNRILSFPSTKLIPINQIRTEQVNEIIMISVFVNFYIIICQNEIY